MLTDDHVMLEDEVPRDTRPLITAADLDTVYFMCKWMIAYGDTPGDAMHKALNATRNLRQMEPRR